MSEFAVSVLSSLAASGLLVVAVLWLGREWISVRLKSAIQHEYDSKLESLRAHLKAETEVATIELKATIERQAHLIANAHSAFAEGQRAAMERTLQAVDALWSRIVTMRSGLPPILGFVDILTSDEYATVQKHPTFIKLSDGWTTERLGSLVDAEIERTRPYVGEYAWWIYFCYQAIMIRIVFLMNEGRSDVKKLNWHTDTGTRSLIEAVLTAKELAEFEKQRISKITWLQRNLESKLLTSFNELISGRRASEQALEQARSIQEHVRQLEAKKAALGQQ